MTGGFWCYDDPSDGTGYRVFIRGRIYHHNQNGEKIIRYKFMLWSRIADASFSSGRDMSTAQISTIESWYTEGWMPSRSHRCLQQEMRLGPFVCTKTLPDTPASWKAQLSKKTKCISLTQLFLWKNKIWPWANPALWQHFTLWSCKTHPKHTYIVSQKIEKNLQPIWIFTE